MTDDSNFLSRKGHFAKDHVKYTGFCVRVCEEYIVLGTFRVFSGTEVEGILHDRVFV